MNDLTCYQCRNNQSSHLLYFKKYYNHSKKIAIYDPMLLCHDCMKRFKNINNLFEHQPVLISFDVIAKTDIKKIMWLASDKGKEYNAMGFPIWRKRLLHIKKFTEGVLQSPIYWGMR